MQLIIKLGVCILNALYFILKLTISTKDKVLLISRQSNEPSIDFILLKNSIITKYPDVEVKILCHTLDGGLHSSIFTKIHYGIHMLKQMKEMSSSKVVVLDTYCMVASLLKHKRTLKIIQMWHSIGTMKKFGYTALDTEEGTNKKIAYTMHMHDQYSYVLASSSAYKSDLALGFNCSEDIIKVMPLPRLDLLHDKIYKVKKREEIFALYPLLSKKTVIVYAPTFRKNENEMQNALDRLTESLYENQILVLKLHPLSKLHVKNDKVLIAEEFSTFDMLFVANALISDYSCVIYEAASLDIPLYFYNFDMNNYIGKRGLAIDYEHELPGVISKNPYDITTAIAKQKYDFDYLKKFCNKYVNYNGQASDTIADFIYSIMRDEVSM